MIFISTCMAMTKMKPTFHLIFLALPEHTTVLAASYNCSALCWHLCALSLQYAFHPNHLCQSDTCSGAD